MASSSCNPATNPSRYVVGLDFGTTFSGIAYARRSHPDQVSLVYQWPSAEVATQPYCKTTTALWYVKNWKGSWDFKAWGWPAVVGFCEASKEASQDDQKKMISIPKDKDKAVGRLLRRFKLLLADEHFANAGEELLPGRVTVDMAIEDYLRSLALFTVDELRKNFGGHVLMTDIEWALTVPAIWGDQAKQRMRNIAKAAGMVGDNGENVKIVLEPEAAAAYCHHSDIVRLLSGDKFMVLDAGGGTVDIVVHEKAGNGSAVKEVTRSDGGLCGSSFLDAAFFAFLEGETKCLHKLIAKHPDMTISLMKRWDDIKRTFNGDKSKKYYEVPPRLATAWRKSDPSHDNYDEIEMTCETLKKIVDPTVNKLLEIAQSQLDAAGGCKAILLVGGFAESPYLLKRVQEKFSPVVQYIVKPPSPGAAICHGAVLEILNANCVLSRVSRKTYGMKTTVAFVEGVHPKHKKYLTSEKEARCIDKFDPFVTIGDSVNGNVAVTRCYNPVEKKQKSLEIKIYSSTLKSPQFVDEAEVRLEGSFRLDMSDTTGGKERKVEVSMFFGRTSIEVHAKALNFGHGGKGSVMPIKFGID